MNKPNPVGPLALAMHADLSGPDYPMPGDPGFNVATMPAFDRAFYEAIGVNVDAPGFGEQTPHPNNPAE